MEHQTTGPDQNFGNITVEWKSGLGLVASLHLPKLGKIVFVKSGKDSWRAEILELPGVVIDCISCSIPNTGLGRDLEEALDNTPLPAQDCDCKGDSCSTLRQHAERVDQRPLAQFYD